MNFSAYLDAIEALVAARLAELSEGAIPVSPSAPVACTYCPAYDCPGRLA